MTTRTTREYSSFELVFGNLAIILWIILGSAVCALFNFIMALGYCAALSFLIFFEIGKHGCVTCYYCKTCTIGMGKLPEFFFTRKGKANVNKGALRLFPFVYFLLSATPLVLLIYAVLQELTMLKVILFVAILLYSLVVGAARITRD